MSAMTATVQHDKIIMMTDACFYSDDGTVALFERKVFPVPGLTTAAFSSRGVKWAFDIFKAVCSQHKPADWEDLVFNKLTPIWRDFDALMDVVSKQAGKPASISRGDDRGLERQKEPR